MDLKVIDNKGKESSVVTCPEALLSATGSKSVVHEVVVAHLANQRSGTHAVKTRGTVSGGGKKPWKQKHTGNARSGSTRSPLWRHGGIIFGPVPRDYSVAIPKKKRQLAFKMAVKDMIEAGRFQLVDPIQLTEVKTKKVAEIYSKWKVDSDSLLVVDIIQADFLRAARNIPSVQIVDAASLNTYDCLRARRVYCTPAAFSRLSARMGVHQETSHATA